jgi:hypothetical protein
MTNEFDARIDDRLRTVGAEWRRRRPGRAGVDPSLFAERRSRPLQAALASVAGALALIMVAVLIVVSLPASNEGIGTASASPTTTSGSSVAPTDSAQPTSPPSPPLPTSTPSESPTPSPTDAVDDIAWESFRAITPEFDGGLDTVQAVPGRFLARAHRCPTDRRDCEHVLLESADAEEWTVIARIRSRMVDALEVEFFHEEGLGFLASASIRYSGRGAGLWHSVDGITWDEVGDQLTFELAECEPQGVDIHHFFRTVSEVVALGRPYCSDNTGDPNLAWTSVDGRTWQPAKSIPVSDVVADHGTFVGDQIVAAGTIWQSDDGLVWTTAAEPGTLVSIGSVSAGFVAVEWQSGRAAAALLTSADGKTWVEHEGVLTARDAGGLGWDGQRAAFIETGSDANVLWVSSSDGTDWSSYSMPAGTDESFDLVAILGSRLVVYSRSESAVWVGDIP